MGLPDLRLTAATAVFAVVGPELVLLFRLFAMWLIPLAAIGAIAFAAALPSSVLGALMGRRSGWGVIQRGEGILERPAEALTPLTR